MGFKRTATVLVFTAVLLGSFSFVAVPVRADWIPYATLTQYPYEVFPGETITFNYNLSIGTIPNGDYVNITSFVVKYDWESTGVGLVSVHGLVIPMHSYDVLNRTVVIPQTVYVGQHTTQVTAVGYAEGDSAPTTKVWSLNYGINQTLTVSVSASRTTGPAPLSVNFLSAVSGGAQPYSYLWTFGDGTTSSLAKPAHTYNTPGTYTARLTVQDNGTREADDSVVLVPYPQLEVTISCDHNRGTVPLTVNFTSAPSGGTGGYTYYWLFGDGGNSTTGNSSHAYASVGRYTTTLLVTDSSLTTALSNNLQVIVDPKHLSAAIACDPGSGQKPLLVSFTSTVTGGVPPYTYLWTFGDGSTSIAANPGHRYTSADTFTVTLQVSDSTQTTASSNTLRVTVITGPPSTLQVSISSSAASGEQPLSVSFSSAVTGGNPAYTYNWTFGDGGTSTSANPTYVYASAGNYTVKLVVTDAASNSTTSNEIHMTVTPKETSSKGLDPTVIAVAIVLVLAVAAIVTYYLLSKRKK
jgi:PKD repeat protein